MLNSVDIIMYNDNGPLPENHFNIIKEEYVCKNWGHSGIYHQHQVVNMNAKSSLKAKVLKGAG